MPTSVSDLKIVRYPDPVLQKVAPPIEAVTAEVRAVAERMIELMHEEDGIGLAAPQVGLSWRMFVTAGIEAEDGGDNDVDRVYINPELSNPLAELEPYDEGCLSLPNITVTVVRPLGISIRALGLDGELFELTRDDMLARVWQHENDHLDGRLIIDRMSPLERISNRKAIKSLREDAKQRR